MIITPKHLPHSQIQFHIEIDQPKMVEFFARAYERLSPHISIKGFRPGHAPKSLILESIGIDRYTQEAVNLSIIDTYYKAVQQEKVIPLTQPAVSIHAYGVESELIFDATVDILPKVELPDYKKLKVKLPEAKTEATKDDVDTIIKRLRFQAANFTDVDRGAEIGDRIEIHFTGKVKGVVQEDLTSQHYPLILGETQLIPGFEKELIGIKKGEEKDFKLKIEAKKDKFGGARNVEFSVECLIVQATKLPELNDEFAKNFGHETIEKLTAAIEKGVEHEKKEELKHARDEVVLAELRKATKIDLPATLIDQEVTRRIEAIKQQLGQSFDKFLEERYQKSIEELRKSLAKDAEASVATGLILGEVARAEKLVPTGGAKTPEQQNEIVRKTLDKLTEYMGK